MDKKKKLPEQTKLRLPEYYKTLSGLLLEGVNTITSKDLGALMRVRSDVIRQDFGYFDSVRGVNNRGYDVERLLEATKEKLDFQKVYKACVVGLGNLGKAFARYNLKNEYTYKKCGMYNYPLDIVAGFDVDANILASFNELPMFHVDMLESKIEELEIDVVVLAVPEAAVREISKILAKIKIKGVLNFASTFVDLPSNIAVRHVDLLSNMQMLLFSITNPKKARKNNLKE